MFFLEKSLNKSQTRIGTKNRNKSFSNLARVILINYAKYPSITSILFKRTQKFYTISILGSFSLLNLAHLSSWRFYPRQTLSANSINNLFLFTSPNPPKGHKRENEQRSLINVSFLTINLPTHCASHVAPLASQSLQFPSKLFLSLFSSQIILFSSSIMFKNKLLGGGRVINL